MVLHDLVVHDEDRNIWLMKEAGRMDEELKFRRADGEASSSVRVWDEKMGSCRRGWDG
jgi:hypothetical protein